MKKSFKSYLRNIGCKTGIEERVEEFLESYKKVTLESIKDIFVSECIKQNGGRLHQELYLFSKSYYMEALIFISPDKMCIGAIPKKFNGITFFKKDYDFKKATEKSRLHIETKIPTLFLMTATQENCDFLFAIYKKYLKPNL